MPKKTKAPAQPVRTPSKEPRCGLTEEQFKRFDAACQATFNALAPDLGNITMPRSHVIDVVCDADYLLMFGERRRTPEGQEPWEKFYMTVIRPLIHNNFDTPRYKALMKEIFPHRSYSTY